MADLVRAHVNAKRLDAAGFPGFERVQGEINVLPDVDRWLVIHGLARETETLGGCKEVLIGVFNEKKSHRKLGVHGMGDRLGGMERIKFAGAMAGEGFLYPAIRTVDHALNSIVVESRNIGSDIRELARWGKRI